MEGMVRGNSDLATIEENGWHGKGMAVTKPFSAN